VKAVALAALLLSGAAEARFAPRLDAPYRLVRVQERDDGTGPRRFASEREVTFARRPDGYLARMTLRTTHDSAGPSDYAMLAAAMAGQAVEVELDRAGHLRRVRDLDAIWARLRTAIGEAARDDRLRLALWRLHDAATTTQRVQVVAGVLLAALAADDAGRRPGTRAATFPAEGGGPPAAPMRGEETVTRDRDRVSIAIVATADGATLSRHRLVDRRTGLVLEQRDLRRFGARIAGRIRTVADRTTVTLTPAVS
jgi:hypothetical protein